MEKQEAKIVYKRDGKDQELFFFAHDFQSAYAHAQKFVDRNKGKFEMKLYVLNENYIGENGRLGPMWVLDSVISADASAEAR